MLFYSGTRFKLSLVELIVISHVNTIVNKNDEQGLSGLKLLIYFGILLLY